MTKRIFSLFLALQLITATAFAGGSQPATPGGSNGQIQYNNSGAMGGLTIGGDCSINVGTGVLTCTKTGGVNFAASATIDTTAANNITSGTLPAARLPSPGASTLGGVQSATATANQFLTGISTLGVPTKAQPAFTDISGTASVAQGGTGVTAAQGNGTKVQLSTGTTTTNNCVKFDANGNTVDAGTTCGGGGSVSLTSASPNVVLSPSTITGTGTIALTDLLNTQTGTSYPVVIGDIGKTITNNNASATAVTLPSPATTGFGLGASYAEVNLGAGVVTITPTSSTINGATTHTLHKRGWVYPISDGTNYIALGFPGFDTITANALPKFVDGSGATTASGISDTGTTITFGENATATGTLTLSSISGSTQCLHANSSGLITGTGSDCGAGSGGTLGTSVSAASPSISGDATTGLYTSAAAKVDVSVSGSRVAEWGTAGEAVTGTETITSNSASALAVGANGATNPALTVDASQASAVTGAKITAGASGAGVNISATSSATNEAINIISKNAGAATIQSQTGTVNLSANSNTSVTTDGKSITFTPSLSNTATLARFSYTASTDTALTASTEAIIEKWNNATTRTHTSGALALQEDFLINGATDAFSAASTLTTKTTLSLVPGNCGTNGTCTNITSLYIPSTAISGTVPNSYGAMIAAHSGATKNFAALFTGQIVNAGTSPTTSAGVGAGTSPTITLTSPVAGGLVSVTTGTSPTGSNANVVTVTYPVAFATNSAVTLTPANAATAALTGATAVYALGTTTGFTIVSGSTALTASTAYAWNYHVDGQ